MQKICSSCGKERDAEQDFNWKHKERSIRQTRCKFCQSQVSKRHYTNNKQSYIDRTRTREILAIADCQRKLAEYLACHPCVDCGQSDIRVLEFDHVRGKKSDNISRMLGVGYSWTTIEAEIVKCEVRCVNCHRIKTGKDVHSWRYLLDLEERA